MSTTGTVSTVNGAGKRVMVLIGTRKGVFIAESDTARTDWQIRGPYCEGRQTLDVNFDPETKTMFAATAGPGGNGIFEAITVKCPECNAEPFNFCAGPDGVPLSALHPSRKQTSGIWRSSDLGQTWAFSANGLTYGEGGPELAKVWNIQPTPGGVLYAGVEPAGLFKSTDNGDTWEHVSGLTEHPSRKEWNGGNGGLCLHSIVVHPENPDRIWVGTSAAGSFMTSDGGKTWDPANYNVRNFDTPAKEDEVSGCVHKLRGALNGRDLLYQQNHFGVYRSENGGKAWKEVTEGLPSEFGFGMAVHPHDSQSIYVIPLSGDGRFVPEGKAAVWRSRDGGDNWTRQDKGLPQNGAFFGVLREGMANDTLEVPGIYFGTNTGEVWGSPNEGDSWQLVAGYLPPVLSVETAVVDA
jgi:photosystem II stability/assembly factor-like uncharacterized protein